MYDLEDKVLQLTWEWQLSYLMSQREPGLASQDKAENQKDSHGGRQGSLHPIQKWHRLGFLALDHGLKQS